VEGQTATLSTVCRPYRRLRKEEPSDEHKTLPYRPRLVGEPASRGRHDGQGIPGDSRSRFSAGDQGIRHSGTGRRRDDQWLKFYYTRGEASRETKAPVTSDTIFELGSVSKIFNVTLAAVAEQRGLLSLDQPVSTYLPELKGSAFDKISLVNLATHTSGGLPLQVPDSVTDDSELMTYLKSWKPAYKAGTMRSYSNVSIGLLGRICRRASRRHLPASRRRAAVSRPRSEKHLHRGSA